MAKAIILLSGGLDSATCLYWAKNQGYDCYTLSFDYGQKHRAELNQAKIIAQAAGVIEHKVMQLSMGLIGGSSLTDHTLSVPDAGEQEGIPNTYVPARNTIFLSMALGWAEVLECRNIVIGVSAVDYSGYPDCRPEFITAFQNLANLATKSGVEGNHFYIHSPLIQLSKQHTIQMGLNFGVDYSQTVSCYRANEHGEACGSCDSCVLRKKGFLDQKTPDPTRYISAD